MEGTIRFKVDVRNITNDDLVSDALDIGNNKWYFGIRYECSKETGNTKHLSIYTFCEGMQDDSGCDVKSEYRIINQLNEGQSHSIHGSPHFFCSSSTDWGHPDFIKWNDFVDPKRGYILENYAILEAKITVLYDYEQSSVYLRGNMKLSDCAWMFPNFERLRAISTILGERSEYFAKKLDGDRQDIDVDANYNFMFLLMNLLHNHDQHITDITIGALLRLTKQFDCPVEIQQCEKYIIESTTIPMIRKLKYADEYDLDRLKTSCLSQLASKDQVKSMMSDKEYSTLSNSIRLQVMEYAFQRDEKDTEVKQEEYIINGKVRDFKNPRGWLTDAQFIVNGEIFHVSKQILQSESEVFAVLFENDEDCIIGNTESNDFDEFLQMIYQPTNYVTNSNYIPLMQLSSRFKVNFILRKCEEFVINNKNLSLIDKLIYAGEYNMDRLTEHAQAQLASYDELKQLASQPRFKEVKNEIVGRIVHRLLSE